MANPALHAVARQRGAVRGHAVKVRELQGQGQIFHGQNGI
jgi:hypothetical protein